MKLAALLAAVLAMCAAAGSRHDVDPEPRAVAVADCVKRSRPVIVNLDNRKHRDVLRHAWVAQRAGQPELLRIDRPETDANRRASLRHTPSWGDLSTAEQRRIDPAPPLDPHDRDEYPPAMSDEGGRGASVRYIGASANRSAGSTMGGQLRKFCNGQVFRFERKPGPR